MIAVIVGSLTYLLIKILGYSAFAKYLNALFNKNHNPWKIGAIRTALGVVFGYAINMVLFSTLNVSMGRSPIGGEDTYLYLFMLVVLRIIEWGAIIFWFYTDKTACINRKVIRGIVSGIVCSFVLDIPLMLGLFVVIATIC